MDGPVGTGFVPDTLLATGFVLGRVRRCVCFCEPGLSVSVCVFGMLYGFVLIFVYLCMFEFVSRSQCVSSCQSLSLRPVQCVCMSLSL